MSNPRQNPNCDSNRCKNPEGQIRSLPLNSDSNLLLCYACYLFETKFRVEFNKACSEDSKLPILTWNDLKVYPIKG